MKLTGGNGTFEVVINLANGELLPYADPFTANKVHEILGGKNYYQSRSGRSVAGFIPNSIVTPKVSTYRVDGGGPWTPEFSEENKIGDLRICAPIEYQMKRVSENWPVLVRASNRLYLLTATELPSFLRGELQTREHTFEIRYIPGPGSPVCAMEVRFWACGDRLPWEKRNLFLLFREMNMEELRFQMPPETNVVPNPLWRNIGWIQVDELVYVVRGGICQRTIPAAELGTLAGLQKAEPTWAHFISPNIFLTTKKSSWGDEQMSAVAFVEEWKSISTFEVSSIEFTQAIGGKPQPLIDRIHTATAKQVASANQVDMQDSSGEEIDLEAALGYKPRS